MALRIRCPSCKTVNSVDEEKRGRKVRCKECEKPISVPDAEQDAIQTGPKIKSKSSAGSARDDDEDDDYDDRPRRKRRAKSSSGDSSMMYLLIGGGLLGLFLCFGVAGAVMFTFVDVPVVAGKKLARDRKRKGANQDFNLVAKGKVVLNVNANLTENDPPDPTPALREFDSRMKVHQVMMQPGKAYVITMDSDDFDTYLRVESPQGANLVEDDDSGGDLNSKIVFRPAEAGMHRIIATSFDGDFGRYQLKVQEVD